MCAAPRLGEALRGAGGKRVQLRRRPSELDSARMGPLEVRSDPRVGLGDTSLDRLQPLREALVPVRSHGLRVDA